MKILEGTIPGSRYIRYCRARRKKWIENIKEWTAVTYRRYKDWKKICWDCTERIIIHQPSHQGRKVRKNKIQKVLK